MKSNKKFNKELNIEISDSKFPVINILNLNLSISENWSINVFQDTWYQQILLKILKNYD